MALSSVGDVTVLELHLSPVTTCRPRGPELARGLACSPTADLEPLGLWSPRMSTWRSGRHGSVSARVFLYTAGLWEQPGLRVASESSH